MNIGNITSDNFNLDCNGKDIQIEVYEQLIKQLQQENQEYKEVINKAIKWVQDWTYGANDWFEEDSKPSELLDILKEVE